MLDQSKPESISSLKGLRVAVGAAGSGTREMIQELLATNGMSADDMTLVTLDDRAAAAALRADQVDVVATVTSPLAHASDTPAEIVRRPGGGGANVAARLAAAGLPTLLVARVGEDAAGRAFVIDSYNIHRLIIAGVTVASKFFSDVFYTNSRYAKVSGYLFPISSPSSMGS